LGCDASEPFFDTAQAVGEQMQQHQLPLHCHIDHYRNNSPTSSNSPSKTKPENVLTLVKQRPYVGSACPICYEEFTEGCQVLFCDQKCGNSVHQECFQAFVQFAQKTNCPVCRTPISAAEGLLKQTRKRRRIRY
jgi:hypothetical protein